jgi:predicted ATPase
MVLCYVRSREDDRRVRHPGTREAGPSVTSSGPRIRTPDQRVRVFVSSTMKELAVERLAVQRAIETLRLTPVMFELGARPYPPRALYRAYLEQSHVFIGIYWQSYGWVAPDEEVSGLEDEYRLSGTLPRLVYIKGPAPERQERLVGLLESIEADDQASYRHFASSDELEQIVKDDLMVLLTERFEATGDPLGPAVARRPLTAPPVPITPTVGREGAIAEVQRLLAEGCRILTLVGPGGVGKSRLALEACRHPGRGFPDGVAFVPLETVQEPSDAIRVLADRVGATVEGAQTALDVAIDRLRERQMLLLIDNFEQVLGAGPALATLLDACPGVSALVTSRRPLRLRGERQLTVEPLGLPALATDLATVHDPVDAALRSPAVALFVERAQRVRPGFVVARSNVEALVDLVRRLDGLPLAIELVAARAHLLEPGQMLERLERGTGVPMSAGADFPQRQRTLRATLEWSHDLLTPSQQTLLARLGIFADGATLEAIESVCSGAPVSDLLDDLSELLDNGLLRADRQGGEGQPRFRLFMTVREFASDQLAAAADAEAVSARFVDWALETAARGDPVLHRDAPDQWADLQVEARNLQLAAQLLIESGDCEGFTRLAWGLFHWMWRYGHMAALARWTERALAACSDPANATDSGAAARLRAAVSWSRFLVGDVTGALAAQDVLDLDAIEVSDPACAALLYNTRAIALPVSDGGRRARDAAERALTLADRTDFVAVRAYSHAFLASLDLVNRDFASAVQHCRDCIAIAADTGLRSLAGQQYGQLALAAIAQGQIDEGRRQFATAYDVLRVDENLLDVAFLLGHAAVLAAAEGRVADAARARAVSDEVMTRLGLAHWHMFELSRIAALGSPPVQDPAGIHTGPDDADPWDLVRATLDLPPSALAVSAASEVDGG